MQPEKKYVKLSNNPDYWLVENGEREKMRDMAHVYEVGLLPIVVVTEIEMDKIPLKGKKKSAK